MGVFTKTSTSYLAGTPVHIYSATDRKKHLHTVILKDNQDFCIPTFKQDGINYKVFECAANCAYATVES